MAFGLSLFFLGVPPCHNKTTFSTGLNPKAKLHKKKSKMARGQAIRCKSSLVPHCGLSTAILHAAVYPTKKLNAESTKPFHMGDEQTVLKSI